MARNEGIRRRNNIINQLILEVGAMIYLTLPGVTTIQDAEIAALPFLDAVDSDIDKFIKGNLLPLIQTVQTIDLTQGSTSGGNWLDNDVPGAPGVPIRQYIIGSLMGAISE